MSWDVAAAAGGVAVVLFLGGLLTEIGPWYNALRTPRWQPPGWAFPVAWTSIGVLTAWAAVVAWRSGDGAERGWVVGLFAVNAALNVAWSGLFFKLRRPDWALPEAAALWLSVLALVLAFSRFSPRASLLLAPYLIWVGIAFFLNRAVVRLNRPFGRGPVPGSGLGEPSLGDPALAGPAFASEALPVRKRQP